MDVKKRLVELMNVDPNKWWTPPELADHLIANGVTFSPVVPGPDGDDPNITELCFRNGAQHFKEKVINRLMEIQTNTLGKDHALVADITKAVMLMEV